MCPWGKYTLQEVLPGTVVDERETPYKKEIDFTNVFTQAFSEFAVVQPYDTFVTSSPDVDLFQSNEWHANSPGRPKTYLRETDRMTTSAYARHNSLWSQLRDIG